MDICQYFREATWCTHWLRSHVGHRAFDANHRRSNALATTMRVRRPRNGNHRGFTVHANYFEAKLRDRALVFCFHVSHDYFNLINKELKLNLLD